MGTKPDTAVLRLRGGCMKGRGIIETPPKKDQPKKTRADIKVAKHRLPSALKAKSEHTAPETEVDTDIAGVDDGALQTVLQMPQPAPDSTAHHHAVHPTGHADCPPAAHHHLSPQAYAPPAEVPVHATSHSYWHTSDAGAWSSGGGGGYTGGDTGGSSGGGFSGGGFSGGGSSGF